MKRCGRCEENKDFCYFYKNNTGRCKVQFWCIQCMKKYQREYQREYQKKYKKTINGRFYKLKELSKRRNIKVKLTKEEFKNKITNTCCYICGLKDFLGPTGYGLDRIDSTGIYELSNVEPCCWKCNNKKSINSRR